METEVLLLVHIPEYFLHGYKIFINNSAIEGGVIALLDNSYAEQH